MLIRMLSGIAAAGAMLVSGAKYVTVNNNVLDAQIGPTTNWQMRDGVVGQVYAPAANADNQEVYFERYRAFFGKAKKYALNVPSGNARENQWLQLWSNYDGDKNFDFLRTDDGHIKHMPGGRDSGLCVAVGANNILVLQQCCDRQEQIFRPVGGSAPAVQNAVSTGGGVTNSLGANWNGLPDWVPKMFTTKRMTSWGADDRLAGLISAGPLISSYNHWELPVVSQMNQRAKFIPMYWGPAKSWQWQEQQKSFNGQVPEFILSINEPDVPSQANMNPWYAAEEHKRVLSDTYGQRGSRLSSPAYAWKIDDLKIFMQKSRELGSRVDAIAIHIYVDINKGNAFDEVKRRVNEVWNLFKLPIVLSELGTTTQGGGSVGDHINLFKQCANFLDNHPGVMLWSWNGCFIRGIAHDSYMNTNLAFYDPHSSGQSDKATLSELGRMFGWNWY